MGPVTTDGFPYAILQTPTGCIIRWQSSRRRFGGGCLLGLAFLAVLFYLPLVAAGAFLVGQVDRAPVYLLVLAGFFLAQAAFVGPLPLLLRLLGRQARELAWDLLFACCGRNDLEVNREWLLFGERVGGFGDFLNPLPCRRVPTRAIQQIIVKIYRKDGAPAGAAEVQAQPGPASRPGEGTPAERVEEKFRSLAAGLAASGNGELAIVEQPGAEPTPYFTGLPTPVLLDMAEQLHRHIASSQPALPPVTVLDKPAAAVRAEVEALGQEARATLEGPLPALWWRRQWWLRALLLVNSLIGLIALWRLVGLAGTNAHWTWMALGCVLVELFVVTGITAPAGPRRARGTGGSSGVGAKEAGQ
jgi:hypothetical protein